MPAALKLLLKDQASRKWATNRSLYVFGLVYFPHYFDKPPADFHNEMADLMQDESIRFLDITGFRGCAKSTWAATILVIFSMVTGRKKFPLLINETGEVNEIALNNVKAELEGNEALRQDWGEAIGDFKAQKWTGSTLVLANGSRLLGRSRGQKIRGLRHMQHRPDLVVIDDVEEEERVDKKSYRDKTENWVLGAIIPAIEETKAKLIAIGNLLHTDALMARLKKNPVFVHRSYPLVTADGRCTWRGKYPDAAALAAKEAQVKRTMWLREFLLKVVPPEGREVQEEWIRTYDDLPPAVNACGVGVDLAISKRDTADFTAMVSGLGNYTVDGAPRIYVLPRPVNARLSSHETTQQMRVVMEANRLYTMPQFFIEDVGYQRAAIEAAQAAMIPAIGVRVTTDKRARLRGVASFIQNGTILFPKEGCEDLIDQLVNFGVTDHDDLADAFVHMVNGLISMGLDKPEVIML